MTTVGKVKFYLLEIAFFLIFLKKNFERLHL